MDFVLLVSGHLLIDWRLDPVTMYAPAASEHEMIVGVDVGGKLDGVTVKNPTQTVQLDIKASKGGFPQKNGHLWIDESKTHLDENNPRKAKVQGVPYPAQIHSLLGRLTKSGFGNTKIGCISSPKYGTDQFIVSETSAWVYQDFSVPPQVTVDGATYQATLIGNQFVLVLLTVELNRNLARHTGTTANDFLSTDFYLTDPAYTDLTMEKLTKPYSDWLALVRGLAVKDIDVRTGSCDQVNYGK